jgi:hypothetical protein
LSETLLCTCGKKFNSMEEASEHLADNYNPDHAITDGDGNILFPRRAEYAKAIENEKERRAKGILPKSDADYYYECTCGAVFFDQRSGVLHMDEHPADPNHLISAKPYAKGP